MSSEAKSEEDLREEIGTFLQKNFPQIEMHGGSAAIQNLDRERAKCPSNSGVRAAGAVSLR
jgi:Fe/S biogenesis protein NfuA